MASLNQLVSEFAHSLGQPNNFALRENIRSLVIHTRNEIIRRSYENHGYVDKILTQRFKVSLTDVNDGEVNAKYVTDTIVVPARTIEKTEVITRGRSIVTNDSIYGRFYLPTATDYAIANNHSLDEDLNDYIKDKIIYYGSNLYVKHTSSKDGNIDLDCFVLGVAGNDSSYESDKDGYYFIIIPPLKTTTNLTLSISAFDGSQNPSFAINKIVGQTEGEHNTITPLEDNIVFINGTYYKQVTIEQSSKYSIYTVTGPSLLGYIMLQSVTNEPNELIYQKEETRTYTETIPATTEDVYAEVEGIHKIKRTIQKVPRPVRLTNNLPFDRVSSVGYRTNREFPYIKETSARFRSNLPGMCGIPCYDYINGYIYLFPAEGRTLDISKIVIESAFERPTEIEIANGEKNALDVFLYDNDEWLLSEDMIGQIKDIIYKRDLLNTVRQTNEIPNEIKYNK